LREPYGHSLFLHGPNLPRRKKAEEHDGRAHRQGRADRDGYRGARHCRRAGRCLRIKSILTEAECVKITDSALLSIENIDRDAPTAALRMARQLFEIQAQTWSPSGKV